MTTTLFTAPAVWRSRLLALLSGALLTCAFAPFNFAYAALVALAWWYDSWFRATAKHAAALGYAAGLGFFGGGVPWVYVSIHDFGGSDAISAGLLTLAFVAFWSLFPAAVAGLAVKYFKSCPPWLRSAATAWLWLLVEYGRGQLLLNGFPWLQIAYSQLNTPLAGFAPITGVYGIGFLLAVTAFLSAETLRRQLRPLYLVAFVLLIWGGGYSLRNLHWTQPQTANPLAVALIQGNINQRDKWQLAYRIETLRRYKTLTEQQWDSADVIIWPETSIPAYMADVEASFLQPLHALTRQHRADLIVSLPSQNAQGQSFNSVLTLGRHWALYHKQHLLPFGEYLPLKPLSDWVLSLIQIPLADFSAGDTHQALLQAGGYRFITTICYEDAFGAELLPQLAQAAFVVNVTNDAWFGDSTQPHQHLQMAQMRALETGRYLLRATNTGVTAVIAPDGSLLKQAPLFKTTVLTADIVPMQGLTPYARLGGDWPVLTLWTVLVAAGWIAQRFGKRKAVICRAAL